MGMGLVLYLWGIEKIVVGVLVLIPSIAVRFCIVIEIEKQEKDEYSKWWCLRGCTRSLRGNTR